MKNQLKYLSIVVGGSSIILVWKLLGIRERRVIIAIYVFHKGMLLSSQASSGYLEIAIHHKCHCLKLGVWKCFQAYNLIEKFRRECE